MVVLVALVMLNLYIIIYNSEANIFLVTLLYLAEV
jgi:hypothetical protein